MKHITTSFVRSEMNFRISEHQIFIQMQKIITILEFLRHFNFNNLHLKNPFAQGEYKKRFPLCVVCSYNKNVVML